MTIIGRIIFAFVFLVVAAGAYFAFAVLVGRFLSLNKWPFEE